MTFLNFPNVSGVPYKNETLPEPKVNKPLYIANYKIPEGGSISKIGNKFIVSKKDLAEANPSLKNVINGKTSLQPGQVIKVPGHKVVSGDTPDKIAKKYGMTTDEFRKLNGLKKESPIVAGKTYYVYGQPSSEFVKDFKNKNTPPALLMADEKEKNTVVKTLNYEKIQEIHTPRILLSEIQNADDVCKYTGVSKEFINDLIKFEKLERNIVKDPNGRKTVGIGHDLKHESEKEIDTLEKEIKRRGGLSDKKIYQLLAKDITRAQKGLIEVFGADDFSLLTRGQKEALVGMTFNNGTGILKKSPSLVNNVKKGCDYMKKKDKISADRYFNSAATEFDHYGAGGRVMPGLCIRRLSETKYFVNENLSTAPVSVKQKFYETYIRGLSASKNPAGYIRDAKDTIGFQVYKDPKANNIIFTTENIQIKRVKNPKTQKIEIYRDYEKEAALKAQKQKNNLT